jgi:hypothetical protein
MPYDERSDLGVKRVINFNPDFLFSFSEEIMMGQIGGAVAPHGERGGNTARAT